MSAIKTGFAVVPGPLMVPLFTVVAHVMAKRGIPVGMIVGAGCALMGLSGILIAARVGVQPDYVSSILPSFCWEVQELASHCRRSCPRLPQTCRRLSSSTGSAIVNTSRQMGTALGVSLIVAILGTPVGYAAAHTVFQHAWWALAAVAFVAVLASPLMTPSTRGGAPDSKV